MRRTIFYTQPISDCGAFITASSVFTADNITRHNIVITSASLGHRPKGYGAPLSHNN